MRLVSSSRKHTNEDSLRICELHIWNLQFVQMKYDGPNPLFSRLLKNNKREIHPQ